MLNHDTPESTTRLTDQAARSAENAIKATQRVANDALDNLASTVHSLRQQTAPLLNRASEHTRAMLQQSLDAMHDSSYKVRAHARRASANTQHYIQDEPVKAVLMALAAGATLAVLVRWVARRHDGQ